MTKMFFDRDEPLDVGVMPTPELLAWKDSQVREHLERILSRIPLEPGTQLSYVIATRHGFIAEKNQYKLSYRPYVSGIKVKFESIPNLIRFVAGPPEDNDRHGVLNFWDSTVYKRSEQLLGCINGIKTDKDRRKLCMEQPDDDIAKYDHIPLPSMGGRCRPAWYHHWDCTPDTP